MPMFLFLCCWSPYAIIPWMLIGWFKKKIKLIFSTNQIIWSNSTPYLYWVFLSSMVQGSSKSSSSLASEIAKARQHIKNSLECVSTYFLLIWSCTISNILFSWNQFHEIFVKLISRKKYWPVCRFRQLLPYSIAFDNH